MGAEKNPITKGVWKLFIDEIAKRLAGVFPMGITPNFDWNEVPVNPDEDEVVIGEATNDLLRLYQLKQDFPGEMATECVAKLERIKEIEASSEDWRKNRNLVVEHGRLSWECELCRKHAELIDDLFWDEVMMVCPESSRFMAIGLRQGRKVVGIDPIPDNISGVMVVHIRLWSTGSNLGHTSNAGKIILRVLIML